MKQQIGDDIPSRPILDQATADAVIEGRHGNLFSVLSTLPLGADRPEGKWVVRAFIPGAEAVKAVSPKTGKTLLKLNKINESGLFETAAKRRPPRYVFEASRGSDTWRVDDCYQFGPVISDDDLRAISAGEHLALWKVLGAHPMTHEGVEGVAFGLWAPNAERVSVVGEFNDWDGRRHVMRNRGGSGVWDIFIPGLKEGARYKYEIRTTSGTVLPLKADPVGFGSEHAPENASVVRDLPPFHWDDADWLKTRGDRQCTDQPISVYEVHLPSWRRKAAEDNRMLSYQELASELVDYVKDIGFTHIELLPISEYPFDGSWGYQPVGLYAPTVRHGTLAELRDFIAAAHRAELGVILDWVPGHFPADAHGLGQFDGTALYEYSDPKEGFHQDWNTLIYNYSRNEVRAFLIANAHYWLEEYHADALRVDAVASMLYRDYSRKAGEWVPNVHGGRENLEAIKFLQDMNTTVYGDDPSVMTVAEESTAWPGVSRPVHENGLGFGFKWNMGWMHDTLEYMKKDPVYRRHDHHKMTFGLTYAFSENFILPLSHDEVVHGKGSLIGRMPGDEWQKFANLRAYFTFMWGHPGKKLLFMGGEFAQHAEWDYRSELHWHLLENSNHAGVQALVRDLNHVYRETPALHQRDCRPDGFDWLVLDDADQSIYAWARYGDGDSPPVICLFNMTPVERIGWRLGVPAAGTWRQVLNSDARKYGGGDKGIVNVIDTTPESAHGRPQSIEVTLPALSGQMFVLES